MANNQPRRIDIDITVSLAAYTAGDVVGGLLTVPVHSSGGGGWLLDFYLTDAANQNEPFDIYIFDAAPTTVADADPFAGSMDIDDLGVLIHKEILAAGDYKTINSLGWAHVPAINQQFHAPNGNLYFYLVPTATPDYAADDDLAAAISVLLNIIS